jgi:DNA polymerase/3'-5' exonuclease PolX
MMTPVHETTRKVAGIFFEVSGLPGINGESFRQQAYARAARTIGMMDEDIAGICRAENSGRSGHCGIPAPCQQVYEHLPRKYRRKGSAG